MSHASTTANGQSTRSVGTLTYTKKQLKWLFFWLLFGDFCLMVADTAVPRLLPLHLNALGVKSGAIGWAMSLGPLVAFVFAPFFGVWSDRIRTRWGRRRPFLMVSTPMMAAGMILLPHLHNLVLIYLVVAFIFAGMVLQTSVFYLYSDVIPPGLIGRFMGAFRFVGAMAAMAFQYFLFPHFDASPTMVWTVVGVAYLLCFQLTLHMVKEGEYPPPQPLNLGGMIKTFVKDGVGSRYIWMLWGSLGLVGIATASGYFQDLFSKNQLHLTLTQIGHINTWALIPGLLLTIPAGWLLDRYGPSLVWGAGCALTAMIQVAGFFWVHDNTTMLIYSVSNSCINAFLAVALMPMLYAYLPRSKFGQLVSTQTMVTQSLTFGSANLIGWMIQATGDNYRVFFLYSAVFLAAVPPFAWLLTRAKSPFPPPTDDTGNAGDLQQEGTARTEHAISG